MGGAAARPGLADLVRSAARLHLGLAGTVRHLTENPVPELQALLLPYIPA